MSGAIREGEIEVAESPHIPRWQECRCNHVDKGECACEDDGMVTHGGVRREAFDHGNSRGGEWVSS